MYSARYRPCIPSATNDLMLGREPTQAPRHRWPGEFLLGDRTGLLQLKASFQNTLSALSLMMRLPKGPSPSGKGMFCAARSAGHDANVTR